MDSTSLWRTTRGVALASLIGIGGATMASCSGETVVPPPPKPSRPDRPKTFEITPELPPDFPDYRTTGSNLVRLDLEPARWDLSKITVPPKTANIGDTFVLQHHEMPNPKNAARVLKVIIADLPFQVETDEQTFKPEGMEIEIDGKPAKFSRTPAPEARTATWRVNKTGRQVILTYPTIPEPGAVVLKTQRPKAAIDRHNPKGQEEDAFVRTSVTLDGITRNGLSLVAPSSAEWVVTLPPKAASFQSWVTLETPPLDKPKSDGAELRLTVVSEGRTSQVASLEVDDHETFQPFDANLDQYAGKTVTLRLEADPGANPVFDWVFVGSPIIAGAAGGEVRRVVVVALDTTRPDHLSFNGYGRPTPEIDAFATTGVTFTEAWSTAPRTRPSFRSSTTGRLPLEAVHATNIGDVFRHHDFATAGIVANVHLQPRFDFDDGFDSWWFDGKARAKDQVDRGLEWLEQNQDHDTYLFLHFMDAHMAYDAPGEFRDRYVEQTDPLLHPRVMRPEVLKWEAQGKLTDVAREQLKAMHDGEMAYLSTQLGRLFTEIDKMPGKTLVVLHSDHGEEFWEHGGFEHNHSLYDELVRTVFVVRPGHGLKEGRKVTEPVTLMDLAPTLYDLLGFEDAPAKLDGRSLVPELAGKTGPERALPVGYLQYAHERWGVVWEGKKYILHTGTGQEELYDLAADAGEKTDLSTTVDLEPYRRKTAEAHGIEIGPGFRVVVNADKDSEPFTITLPAPATKADVLDPEAILEHRANIEWGETPRRTPGDIGEVTLSDDKRTLTFKPGVDPHGIVYVLFDAPQDAAAVTATRPKGPVKIGTTLGSTPTQCATPLCVVSGIVVVPPPTEAARMGLAEAKEDDIAMLCELGYMDRDSAECKEALEGGGASDDEPHGDEGGPE